MSEQNTIKGENDSINDEEDILFRAENGSYLRVEELSEFQNGNKVPEKDKMIPFQEDVSEYSGVEGQDPIDPFKNVQPCKANLFT